MNRACIQRLDAQIYDRRATLLRVFFLIMMIWLIIEPLPWRSILLDYDPLSFVLGSWYRLAIPCFLVFFAFRSYALNLYPPSRMVIATAIGLLWKILAPLAPSAFDFSSYPLVYGLAGFVAYCGKKSLSLEPSSQTVVFHEI